MRGIAAAVLTLTVVSGTAISGTVLPAGASSILVLGAPQASDPSVVTPAAQTADPSVVKVVEAKPEASGSASVVVLDEPAVDSDRVAAIPSSRAPRGAPMVIRAGIVGGASVAPAAASASSAAAESTGEATKSSNGSLRDAMSQAGQAPAAVQ